MSKIIKFPGNKTKNQDLSLYTEGEFRERILDKLDTIKRKTIRSDDMVELDFLDFALPSHAINWNVSSGFSWDCLLYTSPSPRDTG